MKSSGNERVRMAAAERLADILTLREQREQLELRRELRLQSKISDAEETKDSPSYSAQPVSREDAIQDAQMFLANLREREAVDAAA